MPDRLTFESKSDGKFSAVGDTAAVVTAVASVVAVAPVAAAVLRPNPDAKHRAQKPKK
jgi:hypothetical protein